MFCVLGHYTERDGQDLHTAMVYEVGDIIHVHEDEVRIWLHSVHSSRPEAEQARRHLTQRLREIKEDGRLCLEPFPELHTVLVIKVGGEGQQLSFDRRHLSSRFSCALKGGEDLIILLITSSRSEAAKMFDDPLRAIQLAYQRDQALRALVPLSTDHRVNTGDA